MPFGRHVSEWDVEYMYKGTDSYDAVQEWVDWQKAGAMTDLD